MADIFIPDTFMSLEVLASLTGQVTAVGMVTQAVKAARPNLDTYWLRLTAVGAGIALQLMLTWHAGLRLEYYALALINGTMVALSAMKAAELLKG